MTRMADDKTPGTTREIEPPSTGVLQFPSSAIAAPPAPPAPDTAEKASNERLLEELCVRWTVELTEFAEQYVGPDQADDIVQRAFIDLWKRYLEHSRTPSASFEAVLYRSVKFLIFDYRRTRVRRRRLLRLGDYARQVTSVARNWMEPDTHVEAGKFSKAIADAMEAMTPRARELHIMHYRAELTVDEIVAMTGAARPTVKCLLQRGNRILREHLERAGYSPAVRRSTGNKREIT